MQCFGIRIRSDPYHLGGSGDPLHGTWIRIRVAEIKKLASKSTKTKGIHTSIIGSLMTKKTSFWVYRNKWRTKIGTFSILSLVRIHYSRKWIWIRNTAKAQNTHLLSHVKGGESGLGQNWLISASSKILVFCVMSNRFFKCEPRGRFRSDLET